MVDTNEVHICSDNHHPFFLSQIYLWDPPIKICLECQYNFDKSELCHVCHCQVFYLPMAFLSFSNSSTPTIPFFPCTVSTPNVPLNNSTAIFSGQNWTWSKQSTLHSTLIDWKTPVTTLYLLCCYTYIFTHCDHSETSIGS